MELREVFLFRLETPTPAYLWSGPGDLVVQGDAIAPTTTYKGMGEMLNLPAVQQLINGTADRVEFSVSGVNPAMQALATEESAEVDGALVRIGSLALDANDQPYGMVEWEWEGRADVVSIENAPDESGNRTRSISLSVGSGDTGRSRSDLAFFTDADQRRRSQTDAFFSHVAGISAGATRRFGPR